MTLSVGACRNLPVNIRCSTAVPASTAAYGGDRRFGRRYANNESAWVISPPLSSARNVSSRNM